MNEFYSKVMCERELLVLFAVFSVFSMFPFTIYL